MHQHAAEEAARVGRAIRPIFSSRSASGSAFYYQLGRLLTCAHCVVSKEGEVAGRVEVKGPDGLTYESEVLFYDDDRDLALLTTDEEIEAPAVGLDLPTLGASVLFAGVPQGVRRLSVFPGVVSAVGDGLLPSWSIPLIQIAGMINNGNSGGPLLALDGTVLGVVTAKYIPLLAEIETLEGQLRGIPQIPSSVSLGEVDFAKFANLTLRSMRQLATVLGHVQVGTGWAVPVNEANHLEG